MGKRAEIRSTLASGFHFLFRQRQGLRFAQAAMATGTLHQSPRVLAGLDAVKLQAFFYQLPDGLVPLGRSLLQGAVAGVGDGGGSWCTRVLVI
jgi:hypothetical protein